MSVNWRASITRRTRICTDKMRKTISLLNTSTYEQSKLRVCPDDELNYLFD